MGIWIKALILGIIEGLTEFLPVSSTGHLIIVSDMLKFNPEFDNVFNIVIQMGAILSVVIYFWKDIFPRDFSKKELSSFTDLWLKVVIASIPAVLIALKFEDEIDKYLFNPVTVAVALIVGGLWILYSEISEEPDAASESKSQVQVHADSQLSSRMQSDSQLRSRTQSDSDLQTGSKKKVKRRNKTMRKISNLSYFKAFQIGLFQCLALIPGASRSAMTIIGGLSVGATRELSAKFSFFMAIPILMGAGLLKLIKSKGMFSMHEYMVLGFGSLVSFVVAYLVIALFMNYIKKHKFTVFAYYRIALGILVLGLHFFVK